MHLRRFVGLPQAICLIGWLACCPLNAVIFYSTGDPEHNTSAPTGSLTNSGWQFQGRWGAYLGTAISSNAFLTAQHVGNSVGAPFHLNGIAYLSTAFFDDPETDLRIVKVCGTFPDFAILHTNQTEIGKPMVVIGRGTQRGAPVITGDANDKTNGWRWGLFDSRIRWGENEVDSIADGDALFESSKVGDLLKVSFTADAGPNECHLSVGDSAGGLFILDGTWQLAGINYAVDGPYNTSTNGAGFEAAIFDEGGLYTQTDDVWILNPDRPFDQSGAFYATRVSTRIDWIQSVLEQIAAPQDAPILQSATDPSGPFADQPAATVVPGNRFITVPQPDTSQYYRLRGCQPFRIAAIDLLDDTLRIHYELNEP
ncbi:MAG: hypothetical protein KJ072_05945 [Verrucomicrobia bacterium]|nr:hypothetical protein [Verrucomicrobiota bacterium]